MLPFCDVCMSLCIKRKYLVNDDDGTDDDNNERKMQKCGIEEQETPSKRIKIYHTPLGCSLFLCINTQTVTFTCIASVSL